MEEISTHQRSHSGEVVNAFALLQKDRPFDPGDDCGLLFYCLFYIGHWCEGEV